MLLRLKSRQTRKGTDDVVRGRIGKGVTNRKRGQVPIAKWHEGRSALLVPDLFSSQANTCAIHQNVLAAVPAHKTGASAQTANVAPSPLSPARSRTPNKSPLVGDRWRNLDRPTGLSPPARAQSWPPMGRPKEGGAGPTQLQLEMANRCLNRSHRGPARNLSRASNCRRQNAATEKPNPRRCSSRPHLLARSVWPPG
jgi:hypothetical protein